jgi:cell division protein FtsN
VSDEGFREIQLNGKQLIFLVMAATVFSVVVFLIGVLVGRNVRVGGETTEVAATEIAPDPAPPLTENTPPSSAPPAAGAGSSEVAAPKAAEELSYADRLLRDTSPEENLKPATPVRQAPVPPRETPHARDTAVPPPARETAAPSRETSGAARETSPPPARETTPSPSREKPAAAPVPQEPVAATPPPPRPAPATPPPAAADTAAAAKMGQPADPSGPGFAVQVAAYRDRLESDRLAKQLIAKGYPAFVLDPVKGAPTALFRVRVGKYKTLKDAQAIMAQLQNAEQFNTAWIAR